MAYTDEISRRWYRLFCILIYAITSVYVLENVCLLILSFVSSTENYGNCYFCFLFIVCELRNFNSHFLVVFAGLAGYCPSW
jgi:hypothetical protein